ncbi:AtpZ/AtpI family protein [Blastococcus sp. TF02-9]|uniref:AtpZ/AtpI family protein n=1 Tax=Blastococcus sp. TF02-09 TaxID=2250576 RepID=UPI001F4551AF|nr:AtpZ/AtpI family protein [Blastococcus sp. TF02-9]
MRQPSGADVGWGITGTMLSGMIVWGGVGWLLDRWLETRVFTLVGVLLGLGVAIYLVVVKYGAVEPPAGGRPTSTTRGGQRSRPPEYRKTQKGRR